MPEVPWLSGTEALSGADVPARSHEPLVPLSARDLVPGHQNF